MGGGGGHFTDMGQLKLPVKLGMKLFVQCQTSTVQR